MLYCINRLEQCDAGKTIVGGISLDGAHNINTVRKEIGMVFQPFNLFAHLTVMQNLTLAQRVVRKRHKDEVESVTYLSEPYHLNGRGKSHFT